jgi:hypothetical protein
MNKTEKNLVDFLEKMNKPPEKIYNWLNTQMSIARFYGGLTYQGHSYKIDLTDKDKPLVRADVFNAELKESKKKKKAFDAAEKAKWMQGEL